MKTFTLYQKEEILHRIDVREETLEVDPESCDDFENSGGLESLREKIKGDVMEFTLQEITWLKTELEDIEDIGWSNMRSLGPEKVNGHIRSMQNAQTKLNQ